MMRKPCLLLLLLLATLQSFAEMPYSDWWQKANLFYQRKEYDSAADYYEKIASLHPENASVYYNLGNTYYRLNKIGSSVLNYKRALKINPSYSEAKDNLELAQSRIPNRIQQTPDIFFVTWWKDISKSSAAGLWSVISLLLFLLILTSILLRWWGKAPSWLIPQVIMLLLLLCICSIYISYVAASRKAHHQNAVVMQQDAPFRVNIRNFTNQSLVPEGTIVSLESEQDGWVGVALPDGRDGWIPKEALEEI